MVKYIAYVIIENIQEFSWIIHCSADLIQPQSQTLYCKRFSIYQKILSTLAYHEIKKNTIANCLFLQLHNNNFPAMHPTMQWNTNRISFLFSFQIDQKKIVFHLFQMNSLYNRINLYFKEKLLPFSISLIEFEEVKKWKRKKKTNDWNCLFIFSMLYISDAVIKSTPFFLISGFILVVSYMVLMLAMCSQRHSILFFFSGIFFIIAGNWKNEIKFVFEIFFQQEFQ